MQVVWLALLALVPPMAMGAPRSPFSFRPAPPPPPPQFAPAPPPPSKFAQFFPAPPPPPPAPISQDCVYSPWSQWSECTAACDATAFVSRTRTVLKEAAGYGAKCSPAELEQWQECRGEPCARDCVMGDWTAWSACSAACGAGQRQRWRQIASPAVAGGAPCGPSEETEPCQDKPCAVDCQMGPWSAWSECSAGCGEGRRQRLRAIQIPAAFGGLVCGPQEEWEACNAGPCARDCVLGDWAPWSPCPACGQASRSRQRAILEQGAFGGAVCDFTDLSESESCNLNPCPVDCVMQPWSAWSVCSADCGEGRRQRLRSVLTPAAFGGQSCGPAEEWEACNNGPCAVDCVMAPWSAWSDCSESCGEGRRQRLRSVLLPASNGGLACGPAEEWEACNNGPCARDCVLGDWAPWSPCPACGQASRSRRRSIVEQGAFGGLLCDFQDLTESESCNLAPCAVDCIMAQWSAWSDCSENCGEGRRQRLRSVLVPAAFGGLACGPAEEWEACNNGPCAVDCVMAPWSAWSDCSANCGEGRRQRLRSVLVPAAFGGQSCGPAEEWEACNGGPCPQDCVLGDWAPWSQCPACGQASRTRSRNIVTPGAFGGAVCDFTDLSETESCNLPSCAVDCSVSPWSAWSACSAECGAGRQQRLRSILAPAANGGAACPALEDWRQCNNGPCKQPSVCDGTSGTQFFATGCTAEFILCSGGVEFPKICPGPSRFDMVSSTCRLPEEVPACLLAAPAPPAPAPAPGPVQSLPPAPKPAPTLFQRIGNFFSYDTPNEEAPAQNNPESTA